MELFMMGAMAMASFVVGLFFLRFYYNTNDRLFLIFAVAFWLLGMTRFVLAFNMAGGNVSNDEHQYIYLIRLAAFVLILFASSTRTAPFALTAYSPYNSTLFEPRR